MKSVLFLFAMFVYFRLIFGSYLTWHFGRLVPYASELFSREGMISNSQMNPTYGYIPSLLDTYDSPFNVQLLLITLTLLALLFTIGVYRRSTACCLGYGWMILLNRNVLISNPGLAYVGWLLWACVILPPGEG